MTQLIKDAAISKLADPIGAADTSLTVNIIEADLFPAANTGTDPVPTIGKDWFKVVLEDINHNREVIYVRTRTLGSATMSNVLRGQEGTTAISFSSGSTSVYLTATSNDLQAAIDLAAQATTPGKNVLWAATVDAQVHALGSGLQKQIATAFTTTGTSTAYLLTPTPAIAAYVANLSFDVTFDEVCGAAPTLQISGVATPPNLVKQNTDGSYSNIAAGDITANHRSRVTLLSPTQALVEKLPPKFSAAGADIASAATLDLTGRTGNILRITGAVATSAITLENGGRVELIASAGWPLTYHATNNPVQGGRNYICSEGDIVVYKRDGSGVLHNWIEEVNLPGKAIGEIFEFAGTTAPPGSFALPLAATNISRTTYARLFAIIGTVWGAGDGSTTFGCPYCPADYALVQANANVGTSTVGENLAHSHSFTVYTTNLGGGANAGSAQNTPISTNTNVSGGTANLAAGIRVLKCVKY